MAEINKSDIISEGAINAPYELGDSYEYVSSKTKQLIAELEHGKGSLQASSANMEFLRKRAEHLQQTEQKLIIEQNKLAKASKDAAAAQLKQAEATAILDTRTGGLITRVKDLWKAFAALATNPAIAAFVLIAGLIAAATAAVSTFFTTTGEGEDVLGRQTAVWKQFFFSLRNGFSDLGKDVTGFFGEDLSKNVINTIFEIAKVVTSLWSAVFPQIREFLEKSQAEFNKTADDAAKLADKFDELTERTSHNLVRTSETNKKVNELILESQDKVLHSDAERVALLQESIDLKEKQLRTDKSIAKENADAILQLTGLEHGLNEEQTKRLSQKERDALFSGEEVKRIDEAYAHVNDLDANYAAEVKKNTAKIVALKEEIRKDQIKKAEDAAAAELAIAQAELDKSIGILQQKAIDGKKTVEETNKEILRIRKEFADDLIKVQIQGLEKILQKEKLNEEEREALEKKLAKLRVDLQTAYYEQINVLDEVTVEAGKRTIEKIQEIYSKGIQGIGDLFTTFNENRLASLDREEKAYDKFVKKQIKLAGDNEKQKQAIQERAEKHQEEFEKRRIQELRRAAIFEKAVSATQAAINTAVAVSKVLDKPLLAIAVGIAGAAEVAAILSKEIPQYKDGGKTTSELIIAGEAGTERMRTPSGQVFYSPGEATLMRAPIGTEITPHDETMRQLALESLMQRSSTQESKPSVQKVSHSKSSGERVVDLVRAGSVVYEARKEGDTYLKLLRTVSMGRWV